MKKYTVKDNLGNKKTIYAKDLAHAIKLNDAETYRGFKITKIHGDWEVESPDKEMWDYDGSMSIAQVKKAIDKGIFDSKVEDNLDNDIYKALVEVSKNKNTHSSFGWNGIIEGMVENILIKNGSIDKKDRFKVRRQIQQQMKESRVQKLFNDSIKDEASLATTINALVNDEKAAIDAYNVAIKNLEGSIDDTAKQVLINIMKDERRHVENLYAILNGQVTEKNLEDSIHDSYYDTDEIDRYGNKFRKLSREYSSKLKFKANGRFTHIEGQKSDIKDFLDDYFGPNMGPYSIRG